MLLLKRKGDCHVAVIPPGISVLFSYQTLVAATINGTLYRTAERHSRTSLVHVNRWARDLRAYCPEDIRRVRRVPQLELERLIHNTVTKGNN